MNQSNAAATSDSRSSKHAIFSFSGAGFLDLGFETSGFEVVFANEINKEFVSGYVHSRKTMGLPLPSLGIACDSIDQQNDASKLKVYHAKGYNLCFREWGGTPTVKKSQTPHFSSQVKLETWRSLKLSLRQVLTSIPKSPADLGTKKGRSSSEISLNPIQALSKNSDPLDPGRA